MLLRETGMPQSGQVQEALAALEKLSSKKVRDGYSRYGIVAPKSFGVSMAAIQQLSKRIGRDHDLAAGLWDTGWYEARTLTAFVGEPDRVTAAQMDQWARAFDNWAICDTLCFHLFDRTPHAWKKVEQWSKRKEEFVKRASFALLASLALHDKEAPDAKFVKSLQLIERAATDDRNFVKKGVSWALRLIGRRNKTLNAAAVKTARKLTASDSSAAQWIGRGAVRELTSPAVVKRLKK
jgi:3-methyladenine DNA glycosylase AlkD